MTRQGDDMAAQAVLSRLGWGADNARSIGDLAEALNWPRRLVEQAIQDLRLNEKPVCSGPAGIWLGDANDVEATYRQLRGRIVSQSVTAWAMRRTLRRLRAGEVHQESLWEASDAA